MRKFTSFILFSVFLILIIPAFALLGGDIKSNVPKQNNPISKTDYEENNFYLVKNVDTNEVMRITPSDYIKGVVAAEMPIDFHSEALKAQAVAAHTYALRQIDEQLKNPNPDLDGAYLSTDYTKFQAYSSNEDLKTKWGKDFNLNYKKLSECVDSVINEVLTYEDAPIAAAFHSISSGKTESAKNVWGQDISYLSPVVSVGDELSPSFENTVTLTDQEVAHAILQEFPDAKFPKDRSKWFVITKKSESNTITEIKIGSVTTTGKVIRELLKLKSANFTVDFKDSSFTFVTSGYGHGVGMSQYGADYMARQGSDYKEILLHYYSGVSIDPIKQK
ncbi:MAG: stage II sporulation protein D [Oscillospiraceae bacterium]